MLSQKGIALLFPGLTHCETQAVARWSGTFPSSGTVLVHQCQHFHTLSVHSQLLMMRVRILKHVWRGRSLGGSASSIATCEIRNSVHQICCCRDAWHLIHVEVERHPQAEENLEHLSDVCFGMPVEWCATNGKQHTEKLFNFIFSSKFYSLLQFSF